MPASSSPDKAPSAALIRYEELVARALTSSDPCAAFDEIQQDPALTPELKQLVARANRTGVRLTAVLVARLRFERLIQGSTRALRWFEREPREFTRSFRRYHHTVPASALYPRSEAEIFERWLAGEQEERTQRSN